MQFREQQPGCCHPEMSWPHSAEKALVALWRVLRRDWCGPINLHSNKPDEIGMAVDRGNSCYSTLICGW